MMGTQTDIVDSWWHHAACVGLPELMGSYAIFYDVDCYDVGRTVCATCPVRLECLDDALRNHEQDGIWGGHSYKERRRIRINHKLTWRDLVADLDDDLDWISEEQPWARSDVVLVAAT